MVDHKSVVVVIAGILGGIVVGASGCGLLNGFTDGDVQSPLAGVFEGEGDDGEEACVSDDDCGGDVCDVDSGECVECVENDDCDGQICADGSCVDCVVLEDCGEGEVCSGDNECVEAAEGEGEEGEGEGPVFTITPAPVESDNCTATATTLANGVGEVPADIVLPTGWLDAPAPHVVVMFHELGGSPLSWRSPGDVACSMALRGVAVVMVDLGAGGLNGENPYAIALGAVEAELIERGSIGVVAASATTIDFHDYLGVVDGAGGYEKVAYLSGGADFAPTAEEIDAIAELYPDEVLFMAAQDDAQCGPSPPACADYVTEMAVAEGANHAGWSFIVAEGSAHGSDLVTGTDDIVSVEGDDFASVGTPANVALLNFFDPTL